MDAGNKLHEKTLLVAKASKAFRYEDLYKKPFNQFV